MNFIPDLRLDAIDVPQDRARDFDPVWAEALSSIIKEQGLQHPITVRPVGDRYSLVAGLHRYYAHLVGGQAESIPAFVSEAQTDDEARLQEVMENLGRHELIALDRCHHLFELKQVWERMYPETKAGVAGGKARQGSANEMFSFAAATAERIGLSQRAIQMAVKIWTGLAPQTRRRLKGTDLARKQTELKALSELPTPAKQAKVLDLILGEEPVDNVAQALEYLEAGIAPNALEKRFIAASRTIGALDESTFDSVIAAHEDRVIASLKRRGRI
jgi:ParB family transcriptional regulator, chromosome partitioning protein